MIYDRNGWISDGLLLTSKRIKPYAARYAAPDGEARARDDCRNQ